MRSSIGRRTLGLGLAFFLILPSCAYIQYPHKLDSYAEHVIETEREPNGSPEIYLSPHSDGLGWTIKVVQPERILQDVTVQEEWTARYYQDCRPNIPPAAYLLMCDFLGLTKNNQVPRHDETLLTRRVRYERPVLNKGSILLQWANPRSDPFEVETPFAPLETSTPVRLPWLANAMARNGVRLDSSLSGTGRLGFRSPSGVMTWSPLRLTPDDIRAATRQALWSIDRTQWPSKLTVRLESLDATRPFQGAYQAQLLEALKQQGIQVTTWGKELEAVARKQSTQLHPDYIDSMASIGEFEAATLLLTLNTMTHADSLSMAVEVFDVRTGRLLA